LAQDVLALVFALKERAAARYAALAAVLPGVPREIDAFVVSRSLPIRSCRGRAVVRGGRRTGERAVHLQSLSEGQGRKGLARARDVAMRGPNTATEDGTPACDPQVALSAYSFNDGGKCEVGVLQKRAKECGTDPSRSSMTFTARCPGILNPLGDPP
jgi:hypothetical protein